MPRLIAGVKGEAGHLGKPNSVVHVVNLGRYVENKYVDAQSSRERVPPPIDSPVAPVQIYGRVCAVLALCWF